MNTETISNEEGTANPPVEWKDVIREMHVLQAETWKKSAAHWRECARKAWDRDNLAAASHALMIATLAESYAAEEQRAAGEFAHSAESVNGSAEPGSTAEIGAARQHRPTEGFAA